MLLLLSCGEEAVIPVSEPTVTSLSTSDSVSVPWVFSGEALDPDSSIVWIDGKRLENEYVLAKNFSEIAFLVPRYIYFDNTTASDELSVLLTLGSDTLYNADHQLPKDLSYRTVEIMPDDFQFGSENGNNNESPEISILVSDTYEVMTTELSTFLANFLLQDKAYSGEEYSTEIPFSGITILEAINIANTLSKLEGLDTVYQIAEAAGSEQDYNFERILDANGWRLPSEAEWEYIAKTAHQEFPLEDYIDRFAWHRDNSANQKKKIAQKEMSTIGTYDLLGNLSELCFDIKSIYTNYDIPTLGAASLFASDTFVLRGGDYTSGYWQTRPGSREFVSAREPLQRTGIRLIRKKDAN
ncbi:MAG: hypothetical protein Kapaf2KO_02560 [Candidatus Kapaibacteriales bacterium]